MSDEDSWTVSHDMLMIDEVHTSEESENLSPHRHHHNDEGDQAFFKLDLEAEKHKERKLLDSDDDGDEWTRVRPPRSQRKHIELKDLTENDFLSLIEAKN